MLKKYILSFVIFIMLLLLGNSVMAFTVVIDPGHGGTEPGAIAQNGELEKDLNLKIAQYLKSYLEKYEVDIYMTHNGFSGYQYSVFDRAIFAREKKADLLLSIHLNSSETQNSGAEVWVTANTSLDKYNKEMTSLGNKILNNLNTLGISNRGVKTSTRSDVTDVYSDGTRADYYGIICYAMRGCKIDYGVVSPVGAVPADIEKGEGVSVALIEHCFLSGDDYKFIDSEADLKKLGEADAKAVVEQYGLKLKGQTVDSGNTPFEDVSKDEWYYDAIEYNYKNKFITGTSSTTFHPNKKLTRGMLATILWRMEGAPEPTGGTNFTDVSSSEYYYKAIKWASSKKIVSGYTGTTKFGPEDNITREQMVVMLNNYSIYKKKYNKTTADLSNFTDSNKISSYAKEAMEWAVGNKVMSGNNNKLNPQGNATRAEVASIIYTYKAYIK